MRAHQLLVPILLVAGLATSPKAEEEAHPHWGYGPEDGPAHWAELSREWASCGSGRRQSPIDLHKPTPGEEEPLRLAYRPASFRIRRQEHVLDVLDNGHTIQIDWDEGSHARVGDHEYALVQFHFHAPSEHTVDGRHFPMELHLVHKDQDGKLAVVGVLLEEGERNKAYDVIWSNVPEESGGKRHLENVRLEVEDLIPKTGGTWRYEGSLTTPPCSEGVRWFVATEPVSLSKEQIAAYTRHYTGNNRPVQPSNDRVIVEVPRSDEPAGP